MMAEEKRLEALLNAYKKETDIGPDKDRLEQTIRLSKNAFYRNEQKQTASYMEFLIQQGSYIRKRWWFLQFLTLILLWWIMYSAEGNYYVERSMGVLAPVFVILLIPEFWKNRSSGSEEVEGGCLLFPAAGLFGKDASFWNGGFLPAEPVLRSGIGHGTADSGRFADSVFPAV